MIWLKFKNGYTTGKWLLTLIKINKLKKSYFQGSPRNIFHPNLSFNDQPIERLVAHKHLGLTLQEKLSFTNCINNKINKTLKGVDLTTLLPRQSLFTIYKSFLIRPHLDYVDVVYDQPPNESLSKRIESVQYKVALAITGAIQGPSRKKLYQELGLEHLHQRRWMRHLSLFYKFFHSKVLKYIHNHIPFIRTSTTLPNTFTTFYCRTEYFQNTLLPYVIKEWNKLDTEKRSCWSYESFRKTAKYY